ncbi:hypothetical protein HAX54_002930 [Datura stramonium]|uniref:Uncharacterized protein n=1 Tax=Datura stramonium TaxID=4076 RepID=A0ABS8T5M4_DATST|nr:hypothetical protein [Datura stramonium]
MRQDLYSLCGFTSKEDFSQMIRLLNWDMDVDPHCVFLETRDHLYGNCVFAITLWDRLLMWIHRLPYRPRDWAEHIRLKGKPHQASIFRMCSSITSYQEAVTPVPLLRVLFVS